MVVPISVNPNFFPDHRGKKVTGRKDEQVKFEDYLLEKIEPADSSPEPGRDEDESSSQQGGTTRQSATEDSDQSDSHGGEQPDGPGRRIDLRA